MPIDGKSFRVAVLVTAIALMLFSGVMIAREAPRFNTTKIPSLFIARDWPANSTHTLTLSGKEFTCQPGRSLRWSCETMLEGKRLEMQADDMTQPFQEAGCRVTYDGTLYVCEVTLGNGWSSMVIVHHDLWITPARMAELRAQRPLIYLREDTWMALGVAWAAGLAFLTTLLLLTIFNKVPRAELPVVGVSIPLWLLCLIVIVAALPLAMGLVFFLPVGVIATGLLVILIMQLNKRDRKQGPSLAHPVMWASVSLIAVWVINFGTIFGLMMIGYVD